MTGYFDKGFGNWLPDESKDWGYDELGNDVYIGDELYKLEGTDEVFIDRYDCLEYWVQKIGKEVAKDNEIRIDVDGDWEDEVREILDDEIEMEVAE